MIIKKLLHTIAVASTDFSTEAYLDCSKGQPTIFFCYESGCKIVRSGITFDHVSALRKRSERCCTAWHIEGTYDTLVEVEGSKWLEEIRADVPEQYRSSWQAKHYMIYLDSVGCFEFLAESWKAVPEMPC
jgi:hypothetical protein